jgi:uncharacterized protein (DUF2147 family)
MRSGLLLAAASLSLSTAALADQPSAVGFWVTEDHGAVVQVSQCGEALCGSVVGLRTDRKADESPLDTANPDPAKRTRSRCGLLMMGSLKPTGSSGTKWEDGWVYDPESGHTYNAQMQLDGPNTLNLRGYMGISLLGRTQTWTRETGDNKNRCAPPT